MSPEQTSPTTMRCENYDGELAVIISRTIEEKLVEITVQDKNINKYPTITSIAPYFQVCDQMFLDLKYISIREA